MTVGLVKGGVMTVGLTTVEVVTVRVMVLGTMAVLRVYVYHHSLCSPFPIFHLSKQIICHQSLCAITHTVISVTTQAAISPSHQCQCLHYHLSSMPLPILPSVLGTSATTPTAICDSHKIKCNYMQGYITL